MVTPFQAAQEEEARNRHQAIRDDAGNETGADPHTAPIDDATGESLDPARQPQQRQQQQDEPNEPEIDRRAPADIKRAEIAKRFRRNAGGEQDQEFNGDPNDPAMKFGRFGQQPEPEADTGGDPEADAAADVAAAAQAQQQQQELQKKKLIVRGKEIWLTDAEILARAAQVEAADSYLQESKDLLAEARDIRNKAKRSGQDPQHPEDQTGAQDDDLNLDADPARQHPDELEQAIEEIQFGDPKDAAKKIRKVITQTTSEARLAELHTQDLERSRTALQRFMGQNPDLAKDEVANAAMELYMYDIYREDLTKLGTAPADIPTDKNALANLHRTIRLKGHPVRTIEQALEDAKSKFNEYRGVKPKPTPQPQPQNGKARIEVNVDRTARREVIPNQPTRAVAPRPDATRQATTTRSRSQIVMDMRKQRGQVVG
jgi:hypothetical protein